MNVSEFLHALTHDTKTAIGVAMSTIGTGTETFLEIIPDDIGKLATLIGIILSSVLIRTHWRRGNVEYEKARLELRIMRDQAEHSKQAALRRKKSGQPTRRKEDQV